MKHLRSLPTVVALLGVLALAPAWAQDERPDEGAIFGDEPAKPADKTPPQERDAFKSGEATENPLQLGGTYYQRLIVSPQQNSALSSVPTSFPLQFDGFLDGRPNDRIRGYIQARMLYDASKDSYSRTTSGSSSFGSLLTSSTSTGPTSLSSSSIPNNPQIVLDQTWLKFDIARTVFVTAGKQHIKWGTGRFWNPTDFLHPQRRDPLLPYDLRTGSAMVKLEAPWESIKTNFYAVTLVDNPTAASTLGQFGQAFRIEKVIGSTEIGVDAVYRGASSPVYGADLSFPLGPFDLHGEVAAFTNAPSPIYSLTSALTTGVDLSSVVSSSTVQGPVYQATGGLSYSFAWRENRLATIGAEYFFNQVGYESSSIYPVLIFLGQYQPFYTGKHYGSVFLTLEGPDAEKKTSFTLSTIGNVSDRSFISRLDFSWRVLTYLTFESYVDGHFGPSGSEFNFSLSTPVLTASGVTYPAISTSPTPFDVGLGLRVSF